MDASMKKIIWVVGLMFFGLGVILLGGYIANNLGFRITSMTPNTNNVSTLTPYFEIGFNKAPENGSVKVTAAPEATISNYSAEGKKLRIYTKIPMTQGYTYSISFSASNGGRSISKTLTFSPKPIPFSKLPAEQQKYSIKNQDNGPQQDPIVQHLPHGSLDYALSYRLAGDTLILQARIILSNADVNSGDASKQQTIEAYKKEVTDYIKSLGLDPSKYTINYVIEEQ